MFLDRTLYLIKKKGITKNKLLTDLGLSKNSFIKWGKRGSIPSSETLLKIAKYFDVSTDYLLGNTDDPTQKPGEENIKFDDFTFAFYEETKDLSDSDKQDLLDMARIFIKRIKDDGGKVD